MTGLIQAEDIQALFDAIPTPVFIKNESSKPILVNSSACEFYGVTRDQIVEGDLADLFSPDRISFFEKTDREVLSFGQDVEYQEQVANASGDIRTLLVRKRLFKTFCGQRLVVGVSSDLTAHREIEEHHRWALDINTQIPWTATPDGSIDEVGGKWVEVTGVAVEDARGEGWAPLVHPHDVEQVLADWKEVVLTGAPLDFELRMLTRDGSYKWFRSQAVPRMNARGEIIRWYGSLENIHERKMAEASLKESEERFRLAARAAGLGICDYDAKTGARTWSAELKEILGLPEDSPADPALVSAILLPEDRQKFVDLLRSYASEGDEDEISMTLRFYRGGEEEERWASATGSKIFDENGDLARVLITVRDVTAERRADERLRQVALHDDLTGLPNRTYFNERLAAELSELPTSGAQVGLLMLDVDHLKQINDRYGHDAGDAVLKAFAERLRQAVRGEDTVARLGGDEFAVIAPGVSKRDIAALSARIFGAMSQPLIYKNISVECRPSIGASCFPSHGRIPQALLKNADLALYTAKSSGRGSLSIFSSRMSREVRSRRAKISLAQSALSEGNVVAFYQPKIDLSTGKVTGFEALLRVRTRSGGLRIPADIAPAFEHREVALQISDCMMSRTVSDARGWLDRGIEFGNIAVNAGAIELLDPAFGDRFLGRIVAAGIPTSRFQLEVVESVLLGRGAEHVEATLRKLANEGVVIALDDFGTGHASLTHLKKFPVNLIKLDRGFVRGLEREGENMAIVNAVVGLGKNLGIQVVAEGIEKEEQLNYLRKIGCMYGQGYLFSKPVPARRVPKLIAEISDRWGSPEHPWKPADTGLSAEALVSAA